MAIVPGRSAPDADPTTTARDRARSGRGSIAVLGAGLLTLGVIAWDWLTSDDGEYPTWMGVFFVLPPVIGFLVGVLRAERSKTGARPLAPRYRRVLWCFSLSLLIWGGGDFLFHFVDASQDDYPDIADFVYYSGILLTILGIWILYEGYTDDFLDYLEKYAFKMLAVLVGSTLLIFSIYHGRDFRTMLTEDENRAWYILDMIYVMAELFAFIMIFRLVTGMISKRLLVGRVSLSIIATGLFLRYIGAIIEALDTQTDYQQNIYSAPIIEHWPLGTWYVVDAIYTVAIVLFSLGLSLYPISGSIFPERSSRMPQKPRIVSSKRRKIKGE